jgi:hypothetical protein
MRQQLLQFREDGFERLALVHDKSPK